MNVAHLVGDEPFIYTYADDLFVSQPNAFQQMIELYNEFGSSILPCIRIEDDRDYSRYGVVSGDNVREDVLKINNIIEKPGKDNAPSNFASVAGYLLTPDVFDYLDKGRDELPEGKEFYLTDSIIKPMLTDGKAFYACEIKDSVRYDTGNKLDYLKAVVDFALMRDDIKDEFKQFLKQKSNE